MRREGGRRRKRERRGKILLSLKAGLTGQRTGQGQDKDWTGWTGWTGWIGWTGRLEVNTRLTSGRESECEQRERASVKRLFTTEQSK